MSALTKAQARAPKKRNTKPLELPEYDAPLLLAEPSGALAMRLRDRKIDISSDAGVVALVADMVVEESGERMFEPDEVPAFLEDLSMASVTTLFKACLEMLAPSGGAPGNSKPSTSAA